MRVGSVVNCLCCAGVEEGIVFEMPSVVDMLPAVPDKYKGKISWVKVGGVTCPCQNQILYALALHTCLQGKVNAQPAVPVNLWLAAQSMNDMCLCIMCLMSAG
jgi:hypothetical protein